MELSIRSPPPTTARACEANAAVPSASPRSWARAAFERNRRGDVGQHARGPADRRLERLIGSMRRPANARSAASSGGSTASARPLLAASNACASHSRGRDWASSAGSSASHRSKVAPSLRREAVDVLLDQPHGQGGIPGGQRVQHSVVGQPSSSDQAAALQCSAASRRDVAAAGGRGAGRRTGGGSATSRAPHPAAPRTGSPAPPAPASAGYRSGRNRITQPAGQPLQHRGLQQKARTSSGWRSSTSPAR